MNRSIRQVSIFAMVMFFALLANVTITHFTRSDELLNDGRNSRVRDAQFGGPRGEILAANSPIASTEYTGERPYLHARRYTDGPLYAPITGFYSYNYGSTGLEAKYNDVLTGQADSQFIGRVLDTLAGREHQGGILQTTIDPAAQQAAWEALAGREGAVVAIDYQTGAILAWVSTPSFDPNRLSSTDIASTDPAWQELTSDPTRPMNDRATREIYPPGSTFKLVTAAAALEAGMKPETMIATPASLPLPGSTRSLPNLANCGDGEVSLDTALTLSCNTTFANIALQLGADKLREQAQKFGFGTPPSRELDAATSRFPANPSDAELAMSAIGQFEVAASPLQMAMVAGGIANGGKIMEPYVVGQIRHANQAVISTRKPQLRSTAMTSQNAETLKVMMRHVVESGTGTPAQIQGEIIGGKTGTAENAVGAQSYSWFAGYLESKHVAVATFLVEPGNDTATPVARAVLEALR